MKGISVTCRYEERSPWETAVLHGHNYEHYCHYRKTRDKFRQFIAILDQFFESFQRLAGSSFWGVEFKTA